VSWFVRAAKAAGTQRWLCRKDPQVSKEFTDSLEILGWDATPRDVIILSRAAMILSFLGMILAAAAGITVFGLNPVPFVIALLVVPILANHLVTEQPKIQAKLEVLKTLGEAPRTIAYLVVLLKQNPNLEEAVRFAAEYGEGRIARDLKDALWRAWSGKASSVKELLPDIAEKWGKYSVEFKRSVYMIRSSLSEKYEDRRHRTLEKALQGALEGTVSRTRSFVQSLFIPTLVLFSFGTVMPLMLISLMPILSYFGLGFVSGFELAALLAASVAAVYLYSNSILMNRPPAFSRPEIPDLESLPGPGEMMLFGHRVDAGFFLVAFALVVGMPGMVFVITQLPTVAPPQGLMGIISAVGPMSLVWGFGLGVAIVCWGMASPRAEIRERVVRIEGEVLDGVFQIANRMSEDRPPEEALEFASHSLTGTEIGRLFRDGGQLIKQRNVTLSDAFFSPSFGILRDVYSKSVRSLLFLFVSSTRKGVKAASELLLTMTGHLEDIKRTETELRDMLQKNVSMLRATVMVFAPLICGIVVTMHELIQTSLLTAQKELAGVGFETAFLGSFLTIRTAVVSVEWLTLIIGLYLVLLSIVLIRYVTIIENGPDDTEVRLALAKALPVSLTVFTLTLLLSRSLLSTV
jgi:hypothetical protein